MDNRQYSVSGLLGVQAFKFIAELLKDKDLDLNEPMVDNYLFEVGYELGWEKGQTMRVINYLKLIKMLV